MEARIAAARANGRHGGRPRALTKQQAEEVCKLRAHGWTVADLSRLTGAGKSTVYRYLSEPQAEADAARLLAGVSVP